MASIPSITDQQKELTRVEHDYEELANIGIALSSTRDLQSLLELILTKAREITRADAGSLYIVQSHSADVRSVSASNRWLRFKLVQNDSRPMPFSEFTLPISEESIAGYTALHSEVVNLEDVYSIPHERPFHFNAWYDQEAGYRTRSLLSVPLNNARGEVIGVMQLINCKRSAETMLRNIDDVTHEVLPFSSRAVRLTSSLASQAAVAYENSLLYQDIERLVDGFVRAAATAIEQRDPATSGHSERVAVLLLHLADAINRTRTGLYADVEFSHQEMKQLRYAALLHDFGKIAVREQVLVKAKKLEPAQLALLQQRFAYVSQQLETEKANKKLEGILAGGSPSDPRQLLEIDEAYTRRQSELTEDLRFLAALNETSILPRNESDRLAMIAQKTYRTPEGLSMNLLTKEEIEALSVERGSLTDNERREIESHVLHSVNFLKEIPWTPDLKDISSIVLAHHEKLNGTGYPYRVEGHAIPLASRMMTICDIFDALSSADRPYKKAVSVERAIEILGLAVDQNEIDAELFAIFVRERVFEAISTRTSKL